METLENNVLGTNKIPGSEKFTRPEEIKALSKYLGKIRKTQDDHTKLGEESLALYGRKTGKLIEINDLKDHQFLDEISDDSKFDLVKDARPILSNEGEDVVDLLQKKIELVESENEGSNIKRLDGKVEKISDTLDIEKLPTKSVNLTPDEAPENWTEKLIKDVIKLQGNKNTITDLPTDNVELNIPNKTIPLSDKKEELDIDDKVQSLRPHQKLEELKDDRVTPLSDKKEKLVDDRDLNLDSTIDSLDVREDITLSTYKDKISDERSVELSNDKEKLDVTGEVILSDYIDQIEVSDVNKLPDTKVELDTEEGVDSLPTEFDKLNVEETPKLSDHVETIEDKRNTSLSDYRERIEVTEVDSLSDKKIDIRDDREVNLPNEKLEINNEKDVKKLPNDVEILNNYGLEISKLSDVKEDLKDSTTKPVEELSDKRIDISNEREVELDKKKISPDGDIPEPELSEEQILIQEGKNREPENLDDKRIKLVVDDLIEELPNSNEKLNPDNEPEITELSQFVESLDVDNFQPLDFHREKLEVDEKVDNLEDGIFIIDNDTRPPLTELPDDRLQIKANENKSSISKQLDEYIDNDSFNKAIEEIKHSKELDNTGLFNRVIKLLQDIKKDSTTAIGSKEWADKTEALVTTYFNSDNKQVLNMLEDGDEFITNWINSITNPNSINETNRKSMPINDKDQFDPLNSQVRAESSDGSVTLDSFFSFLLKANDVSELSQLLNLYKKRLFNLKVPDAEKYFATIESLQQMIAELPDAEKHIKDTESLTLNQSNTALPENNNYFDRKDTNSKDYSYSSNNKYQRKNNNGKIILNQSGFDFIGALIHTQDLDKFKKLLLEHNSDDTKYNRKQEFNVGNSQELNKILDKTVDELIEWSVKGQTVQRSEYRLPKDSTFGGILGKVYSEDSGLSIAGLSSMFLTNGGNINLNKYLRFTAEKITDALYSLQEAGTGALNSIGRLKNGKRIISGLGDSAAQAFTQYTGISTNKRRMLEETLGMLVYLRDQFERQNEVNRDRLPGTGLLSQSLLATGTKGLGNKIIGKIKASLSNGSTAISTRNRPTKTIADPITVYKTDKDGNPTSKKDRKAMRLGVQSYLELQPAEPTIAFQENKRAFGDESYFTETRFLGNNDDLRSGVINLSKRFKVPGIQTTLKELTGYDSSQPVSSLEDFKKLLIESPYITTPGKFGSNKFGYRSQTLSSNSFWEIKLEPFVHKNMNGGFSYLPSIREINVKNLHDHGIYTGYNEWLPITNFELERAKLATKSLGIYEGEIVYPVGCEFLNELSITMINDSLKSWSGYWRTVMEVSTHNSEPHTAAFYADPYPLPTAIDHTAPVVALYKNITWRCQIYILSPQYSTLKKFDLLVVLKDYTENYVGEIDSPGGDVQLRFSIVGENPPEEKDLVAVDLDEDSSSSITQKKITSSSTSGTSTSGTETSTGTKTNTSGDTSTDEGSTSGGGEGGKTDPTPKDNTPKDPPPTDGDGGVPSGGTTPGGGGTTSGGGGSEKSGNGYYVLVTKEVPLYAKNDTNYKDETIFFIEKRTGDPSKDPNALNFSFERDSNGNMVLAEVITNEDKEFHLNNPGSKVGVRNYAEYFNNYDTYSENVKPYIRDESVKAKMNTTLNNKGEVDARTEKGIRESGKYTRG